MKRKFLLPIMILASLVGLVSYHPDTEKAPSGAEEKIAEAIPKQAFVKPSSARKMLVFSRTAGFRHASIATGKIALAEMGKKTGAYEAVISDDLANFQDEKIKEFDVICFFSTTQNPFVPSKEEADKLNDEQKKQAAELEITLQNNLMNHIRSGKGFVGIHAATDTFYNWADYGAMIGGYFDGHPWTADKEVQIDVEKGQEKHPLAKMFEGKPQNFKEEIYQFKNPYNPKNQHMLMRLNVEKSAAVKGLKRSDGDYGVSWAKHWGKGRVFYTSLGHNHDMFWNPKVLSHYLAGIQWAAGDLQAQVKHK